MIKCIYLIYLNIIDRYLSYVVNISVPTKDCLELICELLEPVLKARNERNLTRQEVFSLLYFYLFFVALGGLLVYELLLSDSPESYSKDLKITNNSKIGTFHSILTEGSFKDLLSIYNILYTGKNEAIYKS